MPSPSPLMARRRDCSYDKFVKLWDAATGKEVRTFKDHIDAVYALAFTPDGKRLLSGAADRTIKVWDAATGERLYTSGRSRRMESMPSRFDPTGKMVAAADSTKASASGRSKRRAGACCSRRSRTKTRF